MIQAKCNDCGKLVTDFVLVVRHRLTVVCQSCFDENDKKGGKHARTIKRI